MESLAEHGSREIWGNRFFNTQLPKIHSKSNEQFTEAASGSVCLVHHAASLQAWSWAHISILHCALTMPHSSMPTNTAANNAALTPDFSVVNQSVFNMHTKFSNFLETHGLNYFKKRLLIFLASFLLMHHARLSLDSTMLECLVLRTGILVTFFYFIKKMVK